MPTNSRLMIEVTTGYIKTGFMELIRSGYSYHWLGHACKWLIPAQDVVRFEAMTGVTVELDPATIPPQLTPLPQGTEQYKIESFSQAASSKPTVEAGGGLYIITEKKANLPGQAHKVPAAVVETVRAALAAIDGNRFKGGMIPAARLAEEIMKSLNITRFNRPESGSFDFQKFFGNRRDYKAYYYYPVKVLAARGEIIHHKTGHISKQQPKPGEDKVIIEGIKT